MSVQLNTSATNAASFCPTQHPGTKRTETSRGLGGALPHSEHADLSLPKDAEQLPTAKHCANDNHHTKSQERVRDMYPSRRRDQFFPGTRPEIFHFFGNFSHDMFANGPLVNLDSEEGGGANIWYRVVYSMTIQKAYYNKYISM